MNRKLFVLAVLFGIAGLRVQAEGFLSSADREVLATCMVLEAGGEGQDGMQAVLNVILNRADGNLTRMMPETVKYGAFSCMSSIWRVEEPDYSPLIRRAMNQPAVYEEALKLVAIMEQGLLTDNTGGATHYHADYVTPYWAASLRYITTIGSHLFYTERAREVALIENRPS
jgi:N-acetylmuramoyl-L-alanine amidase